VRAPPNSFLLAPAATGFNAPPKACPPTPYRPTRTPLARQDSLRDTKLLVATTAVRSPARRRMWPRWRVSRPVLTRPRGAAQSRRVSQTATTNAVAAAGAAAAARGPGEAVPFAFEDSFDFLRVIGKSPTSEVWLVRSRADGALSAVKRSLAQFRGRADRQRYLREITAAQALPEHPHCVRYYRCWQQDAHIYVQTELCAGGSLAGVLAALPPGTLLPEADVWRLTMQVAAGLAHCHAHGVLHLDVKPANVFLDASATAKLGDFGNALLAGGGWESEEGDGGYVAPELLADDAAPSAAADVFSFGATLLEAATCAPPPRGQYGAPVALPPGRSEALQVVLQAMLRPDPTQRPSAAEVHAAAAAQLQYYAQ
jgi:membrane-associated tyrosine/threonine-specific cdc2-inhibitory kinase